MTNSLRTLVAGAVDYAGLFPPAGLDMESAVSNYARYADADQSWMLGRFVVSVSRLDEFNAAARSHIAGVPWRLAVVIGDDVAGDFERIARYNSGKNVARIDMAEVKAESTAQIDEIARSTPPGVRAFVELPSADDPRPLVGALAERRLRAKIRAGGVKANMIPSPENVARFVRACYGQSVGFKGTAGLHHPVRAEHALTYEPHAERAVMHGFLNVMLLAAFCHNGIGVADAPRLIREENAANFHFSDDGVRWEDYFVADRELVSIRRRFAISFGSCSFEEPVADLKKLNLI